MNKQLKKDIFQWDVANWSQALELWEKHLPNGKNKTALTIGERDGGGALYLAKQGFSVTATDMNGVSEKGKALHKKYKVDGSITYQNADALQLGFPENTFDVVLFKSVLGALEAKEKQQTAINGMHKVLKPNGVLLFAENMEGSWWHKKLRKKFINWSSYWRYISYPSDLGLFSAFSNTGFCTYGYLGLLGRTESQRSMLAKLDKAILPLVSKKSRYILVGACGKSTS